MASVPNAGCIRSSYNNAPSGKMLGKQATVKQKPENEGSFLFNETNKNVNCLKINSLKYFENSKTKFKIGVFYNF